MCQRAKSFPHLLLIAHPLKPFITSPPLNRDPIVVCRFQMKSLAVASLILKIAKHFFRLIKLGHCAGSGHLATLAPAVANK
jgi:hypothetical protein